MKNDEQDEQNFSTKGKIPLRSLGRVNKAEQPQKERMCYFLFV
jgi:hypothetical protein